MNLANFLGSITVDAGHRFNLFATEIPLFQQVTTVSENGLVFLTTDQKRQLLEIIDAMLTTT